MLAGVAAGYLLRNRSIMKKTGKAISWTIYIMLFVLGVKIGTNEQILHNLSGIGLQALLMAAAGIIGSILAAALVYKLFFKEDKA